MFENNNGKKIREKLVHESNGAYHSDQENFSSEDEFRGFNKVPIVLCERFNITPYLSEKQKELLNMRKSKDKLLQGCSVKLVREDLEGIRDLILIKNYNFLKKREKKILNTPPKLLKCKVCDKRYSSEKKLQNHHENKHMIVYKHNTKPQKRVSFSDHVIVHEVKEYHRCRKCPKIFDDYKSLKLHMKQVHKKRKCYICFYCSKDFVDRIFFKVHIKLHCDLCGEFLPTKKLYNEHRRRVCRVIKKYECKECKDVYFSFLNLKDHSYSHKGALFVCDICKEQCTSKCGVLHHIQFLHCRVPPNTLYDTTQVGKDVMYTCNSCEHCSIDKEVIKQHIIPLPDLKDSPQTGYEDYVFCDQCSKQFDTETKMLQHKWSHYLKTDDKNQLEDNSNATTTVTAEKEANNGITGKKNKSEDNINGIIEHTLNNNDTAKVSKVNGITKDVSSNTINIPEKGIASKPTSSINIHNDIDDNDGIEMVLIYSDEEISTEPKKVELKQTYKVNEEIPQFLQPKLILHRIDAPQVRPIEEVVIEDNPPLANLIDLTNLSEVPSKPVVDPVSKKTLISKHKCQICGKYLSSNYCLKRHIQCVHFSTKPSENISDLQCNVCEEVFVWPSLLKSHNCIRMTIPEMPFDDARAEIQFDNLHEFSHYEDDSFNTSDFEMPAPIVELTEYDNFDLVVNNEGSVNLKTVHTNNHVNNTPRLYKVTLQEVPIEF